MGVSVGDDGRRWWSSGDVGRTVTAHVDISDEGKRRRVAVEDGKMAHINRAAAQSHSLQHAANSHTLHTTLNHFSAQMACVPASHAQPLGCAKASIATSLASRGNSGVQITKSHPMNAPFNTCDGSAPRAHVSSAASFVPTTAAAATGSARDDRLSAAPLMSCGYCFEQGSRPVQWNIAKTACTAADLSGVRGQHHGAYQH
jgi:hypothetical protein